MNATLPFVLLGLANAGPHVTVAVPAPPHARILRSIELPIAARALRHAGALEVDVRLTLDAHRRHHLHAADALVVFEEYTRVVHVYGPVHGFGPFVVGHLDEGHHGPALAKVIRHKHGKGHGKGQGHGPHDEKHGGKHLSDSYAYTRGASGHGASGHGSGHGSGHDGHGKSNKGWSRSNGNGHGKGHDKGKK